MSYDSPRMKRERKTIEKMIMLYCHDHHQTKEELCVDCQELLVYAMLRIKNCLFQEKKTSCGNCLIHCYKPTMRAKIPEVMRYVGPQMIWHYPILAMWHIIDGWRKPVALPKKKNKSKEGQ